MTRKHREADYRGSVAEHLRKGGEYSEDIGGEKKIPAALRVLASHPKRSRGEKKKEPIKEGGYWMQHIRPKNETIRRTRGKNGDIGGKEREGDRLTPSNKRSEDDRKEGVIKAGEATQQWRQRDKVACVSKFRWAKA